MYEGEQLEPYVYEAQCPVNFRPGHLYLLPKIHKEDMHSRSIMNVTKLTTEKIRKFIDQDIRPHLKGF